MEDVIHALMFIAIFGVIFLSIIGLEYRYWKKRGNNDVYDLKESLTNITTGGLYKVFDGIAIALFIQVFYDYVRQFGFQYQANHGWLSVLFLVIAVDFFFYIYHYGMHKVRWLWSIHVTHHSSKRMNFSTALRQNFLMDLNFGWVVWWMPLAIIGFDKQWTLIAIEASLAYQFFLHTEAINKLGWFEKVFNTPSHHRVHHGCKPSQIDTNFGGVLIIWDKIFGTFVAEESCGKIEYGLTSRQPTTLNPLKLNLDEFVEMIKDTINYKDFSILYRSPSYVEEKYQHVADIPSEKETDHSNAEIMGSDTNGNGYNKDAATVKKRMA